MGLNHTTPPPHHPTTTPPGTFRPLLDKLGSWNLAQTFTRPTRLRNITHSHPNPPHLTLSLGRKLKTWRFKSKVFPSWTLSTWVLLFSISLWEQCSVVNQRRKLWKKSDEGVVAYFPPIILYYPGIIHITGHYGAHIMYSRYYIAPHQPVIQPFTTPYPRH